jgi:hypothetical protein
LPGIGDDGDALAGQSRLFLVERILDAGQGPTTRGKSHGKRGGEPSAEKATADLSSFTPAHVPSHPSILER